MLKFPCLVLDHDDTVVLSEATVNYPCFCRFLEKYRPEMTMSLVEYVDACNQMSFVEMCKTRFSLTDEEMQQEYIFWKVYVREHIPETYPGIKELLHSYRKAGGIICVVSMSSEENILRDYQHHFDFVPDRIYGCDLPENHQKPNPWPLIQIQKEYGFASEELLVIDDMKFAVSMARTAGCPIAFAGWGRKDFPEICREMSEQCDYTFYSVDALRQFLMQEVSNAY